jgi:aminoglycoside phosphotransferase (APT) family kinase protein
VTDIDLDQLAARATAAAQRHWPDAVVGDLRALPGGVSSLTYAASMTTPTDERRIVLKMAPPGLAPVRNRDVLRQARVLDQLTSTGALPVPAVLLSDDALPPLFGMEFAAGESYEPGTDIIAAPPTPEQVRERALAAARALGSLHARDPHTVCPAGEEPTPVAEELARWAALLATVPGDIAPGHLDLHAELVATLPADAPPTLLHGDYRLANMLFSGTELTAVIDWEIWSVGDPRTDLAWLLMHTDPRHRFHRDRPAADRLSMTGMPTADELLATYLQQHPQAEITALNWFLGYCYYKVASTVSVFVKRNRRLAEPADNMVVADESLVDVVARGREVLGATTGR